MGTPSVVTYELRDGAPVRIGAEGSLAAASDRLPAGVYTTFRTYGGRGVLRFAQHLRRLEGSARLQAATDPVDEGSIRRLVGAALDETGHPESRVRLTLAGPRAFATVAPFTPRSGDCYTRGVSCATLDLQRTSPRAKDTRFIATADRAYRDLGPGVEEGLLVAPDGSLLEGLTSNFFAIRGRVLFTEEERVLAGITRALVLELAERRLPVQRRAVRRGDLGDVSEAFVTSASREVMPVVRIDGTVVGDGAVGSITRKLHQDYRESVRSEVEKL